MVETQFDTKVKIIMTDNDPKIFLNLTNLKESTFSKCW